MGTGYKGNTDHYHALSENLSKLLDDFPLNNGYFGEKVSSSKIRNIKSDDTQKTAKEFYDEIANGGIETPIYEKNTGKIKGKKTVLADGTVITWREVSSSDGSPAVDINIERSSEDNGIKQQKIHFVKEK